MYFGIIVCIKVQRMNGGGGEVVFNRVGLPLWRLGRPYLGTEIIYKYTIILGGQRLCSICYYDLCRVWYHGVYVGWCLWAHVAVCDRQ